MRLNAIFIMRLTALLLVLCPIAGAQSGTPALTMDDLAAGRKAGRPAQGTETRSSQPSALALLPASDIVIVMDVQQVMNVLLPKLNSVAPDEILKMKRQLDDFMSKTGIDPRQITTVTVGFSLSGGLTGKGSGAIIVEGPEPDMQKVGQALRAEKIALRTLTHQGRPLLAGVIDSKNLPKMNLTADPAEPKEEMALAALANGLAFGNLAEVKSVLDAQAGARSEFANALHGEVLSQISPSGLVRFSATFTDGFRRMLQEQGEFAAPFAAIQVLGGSLALDQADSLLLDLRARTATQNEAASLDASLRAFVGMGRSFAGGDKDSAGRLIGQLLDQIQISSQGNEVALSLLLPKSMMDQFMESAPAPRRRVARKR